MTEAAPMRRSIPPTELQVFLLEANTVARRLRRKLWMSHHDVDDLRQDLLTDLVARFPAFDPSRGMPGAFAGVVMANRAKRITQRVVNQRRIFGTVPISLDELSHAGGAVTRGDLVSQDQGLAATLGYRVDPITQVEDRIDLERAFSKLTEKSRRLAIDLFWGSPHQLAKAGKGSRSELYRQRHDLRLELMAAGLQAH